MGWTSTNKPSWLTTTEYIKQEWEGYAEVLGIAIKNRNTAYLAVKQDSGAVIAIIYLLRYSNSYHNLSYKSMSEFCGPNEVQCPEKILNLLTPLEEVAKLEDRDINSDTYKWAKEWREKCRKSIEYSKALSKGMTVTTNPIRFHGGYTFDKFKRISRRLYGVQPDGSLVAVRCSGFMNSITGVVKGTENRTVKQILAKAKTNKKMAQILSELNIGKKYEVVRNRFSGACAVLNPVALAVHDYIKGAERMGQDFHMPLNWFRVNFPDEYYILLD